MFAVESKAVFPFALQSNICTVRFLDDYPDPLLVRANVPVIVGYAGIVARCRIVAEST
jgi:hypothetical protein